MSDDLSDKEVRPLIERVIALALIPTIYFLTNGQRFFTSGFVEVAVPLLALMILPFLRQIVAISVALAALATGLCALIAYGAPDNSVADELPSLFVTAVTSFVVALLVGVVIYGRKSSKKVEQ